MAGVAKAFNAVLETGGQSLGWTIVRVPFDPHKAWKQMLRLRVRGTVRGAEGSGPGGEAAFRTSLFPDSRAGDGKGDFHLLVNKTMQREAGVSAGQMAAFTLEPDMEPRPAELPAELAVLLDEEPGLREWYDSLSENTRRQVGTYLREPQSDAARMKRAEQMAERMLGTMEAERELPPALAAAFRRRPKAKAGWAKMTPTQRRMELFAVEAYKSVESRGKRIEKLCDAAEKKA
jgi:uncharacterized protein YdeI (YjbR/CyaY-like superfamily)